MPMLTAPTARDASSRRTRRCATEMAESTRTPSYSAAGVAVAFAAAVVIRAALAGPAGARSVPASLVFSACLVGVAITCRTGVFVSLRSAVLGLAAGAALVAPVVVVVGHRGWPTTHPAGSYGWWALLTVFVASAEEAALRGALFDAVRTWTGPNAAVIVSAVAFGLMHVPFYGWRALPLDLAVGLLLGAVRLVSGTWTAPAIAHTTADLAGWWLL